MRSRNDGRPARGFPWWLRPGPGRWLLVATRRVVQAAFVVTLLLAVLLLAVGAATWFLGWGIGLSPFGWGALGVVMAIGTILLGMLHASLVRRVVPEARLDYAHRHGLCPVCGYHRRGLPPGTRCPECGTADVSRERPTSPPSPPSPPPSPARA